ncbi:MAG: hypothetical protein QXI36_02170 [Candidatus Bathyarchaeia archaeon]
MNDEPTVEKHFLLNASSLGNARRLLRYVKSIEADRHGWMCILHSLV